MRLFCCARFCLRRSADRRSRSRIGPAKIGKSRPLCVDRPANEFSWNFLIPGAARAAAQRCAPPVYNYGRYIGQDPDPYIRLQLMRDPATGDMATAIGKERRVSARGAMQNATASSSADLIVRRRHQRQRVGGDRAIMARASDGILDRVVLCHQ